MPVTTPFFHFVKHLVFPVFGADLYYHRVCINSYLRKYENLDITATTKSKKSIAWDAIVAELVNGLNHGQGYELSVIRDRLNSIDESCSFRNRDVKVYLINEFGKGIEFSYPANKSKSLMVFRVSGSQLADQIRTGDAIKQCALELSQYLKDFSFGHEDRFCDDQDLKQGLSSMKIPEPWLNFFGYLFQFNPNTYQNAADQVQHNKERSEELHDMNDDDYDIEVEKTQTEESTLSVSRCRKIQSLFQVMFYIKHNGRKKTPMHVMNPESVHSLGRGGKIVTQMLNREALCISYPELRRLQHDVASFTAEKNIEIVSLPSHFDPGEFTSVAIDN